MDWTVSDDLVAYPQALDHMEQRVASMRDQSAGEQVWLLEHPPLYTAGTSARQEDLKDPDRFPVYDAGRGGQYTYHGPGQRVAYFMLDLRRRGKDVRRFVFHLEQVIIDTLASFGVTGERREGRVGVWVDRGNGREDKVAAIGVRVRHWITFHGIAINVDPDLSHFTGIVPCGIADHGVTSLVDLGLPVTMNDVDVALKAAFDRRFGLDARAIPPMPEAGTHPKGDPVLASHPVFRA
ncbi:lipoyl(octanoyl) transferase LipB [Yunchengibacter salinarum]|uniref:lipoyl(octanoyl) transferase LipB n=1 Tax=Yunchengibacter salinarum TaxID=3133399 RepID=UPI0035B5B7E9